jgi:hypothetical protein
MLGPLVRTVTKAVSTRSPTRRRNQEIPRFPAIKGKTWNHPAMSDGILLIRNIEEMAAFDLRR